MKRLFISQPMRDKTNEEIETERNRVIEAAREFVGEEIEVIDSFFKDAPHDAKPLWFLGKSLELLSKADVAFFCKRLGKIPGLPNRATCGCAVWHSDDCRSR